MAVQPLEPPTFPAVQSLNGAAVVALVVVVVALVVVVVALVVVVVGVVVGHVPQLPVQQAKLGQHGLDQTLYVVPIQPGQFPNGSFADTRPSSL